MAQLILLLSHNIYAQGSRSSIEGYSEEVISATDLSNWSFYGKGKAYEDKIHKQFCISEDDGSKGVVMVSPKEYGENVVVRYSTMTLTPATVLVAILSASDLGKSSDLSIPQDYDGGISYWLKECENYFFAFRNAPHNKTPFLRKWPIPGSTPLIQAKENVMSSGIYYDMEIGRRGHTLWLKINEKLIFKIKDENILEGGHVAFRARGIPGFKAAFLIKDVSIFTPN